MAAKYAKLISNQNLINFQEKNLTHLLRKISTSSMVSTNNLEVKHIPQDEFTSNQEWSKAKPFETMPTMGTFQMMRNFLPGGKFSELDMDLMVRHIREELGPIAKMNGMFGRPPSVFSHNPEDFEKVLRNEGQWPARPGSEGLAYHRAIHRAEFFQGVDGLIGTQGEQWGSFRTIVNPVLLQPRNVRLYLPKMSQVNMEFLKRIYEIRDPHTLEMPDNFNDELNRWTLESISVVALDKQLGLITTNRDNPELNSLFNLILNVFEYMVDVEFKPPIWKVYKNKTFRKLMEAMDGITDITSKYVDEAIERIEQDCRNGVPEKPEHDQSVLEKLIKIDKKIAKVMSMDLLMTGVDTTSSAFTGVLLCLAKNPKKQNELRQEICHLLPQKDSEFDPTAFAHLPYLRACIKEALRIYPLGLGAGRFAPHDMVLSGYRVPKGTQILLINTTLLENDNNYARANEFIPERWIRPSHKTMQEPNSECPWSQKTTNPLINLPFGFGARSCVGRRIAEMEIEVGVARLVRNFHIEFNYPTENAFKTLLIRIPNIPLKFKFTDVEK